MGDNRFANQSETNWERLRNMQDEDIDLSDLPEVTAEMFAEGIIRRNLKPIPPKRQFLKSVPRKK